MNALNANAREASKRKAHHDRARRALGTKDPGPFPHVSVTRAADGTITRLVFL